MKCPECGNGRFKKTTKVANGYLLGQCPKGSGCGKLVPYEKLPEAKP